MRASIRVNLYTDAGIKDGFATWATVAVFPDGEPYEASGRLRDLTNCTATAELRAIANALHRLIRRGELRRGDSVFVYSDSRAAVDRIAGRMVKRPESSMAKATKVIRRIVDENGLRLQSRWVPGHKPDDHSVHAPYNNRCDRLCREARDLPVGVRVGKARRALETARRLSGRRAA